MNWQFLKGIMFGFLYPAAGYIIVSYGFEAMEAMNIMDETTSSISARRDRTMTLIALCFIIIPLNIYRGRKNTDLIRGMGLAIMILAGVWIYFFKDTIFI